MSLRIAFMGSPEFSVPTLEAVLAAGHEVACVYSQPPRPAGRGKQLAKTAVYEGVGRHGSRQQEALPPEHFACRRHVDHDRSGLYAMML